MVEVECLNLNKQYFLNDPDKLTYVYLTDKQVDDVFGFRDYLGSGLQLDTYMGLLSKTWPFKVTSDAYQDEKDNNLKQ